MLNRTKLGVTVGLLTAAMVVGGCSVGVEESIEASQVASENQEAWQRFVAQGEAENLLELSRENSGVAHPDQETFVPEVESRTASQIVAKVTAFEGLVTIPAGWYGFEQPETGTFFVTPDGTTSLSVSSLDSFQDVTSREALDVYVEEVARIFTETKGINLPSIEHTSDGLTWFAIQDDETSLGVGVYPLDATGQEMAQFMFSSSKYKVDELGGLMELVLENAEIVSSWAAEESGESSVLE